MPSLADILPKRLRNSEKIVLLGTVWTLAIRATGMGIAYISLILFAKWMGETQFGIYSYTLAAVSTLAIVPLFGFSYASIPLIADYEVNRAPDKIRGLLLFSIGFVIVASLAVATVFAALVWKKIIDFGQYHSAILVSCAALPVYSLLVYLAQASRGLGRAIAAFAPLQVVIPILALAVSFAHLQFFNELNATQGIAVWCVSMLILVVAQLLYLYWVMQRRFPGHSVRYEVARWWRESSPFFMVSITLAALLQMDVLILGLFEEPKIVGYYSATAKTALLVTIVLQSINALGARQYATLFNDGNIDELRLLLRSLSRWIVWATAAVSSFLLFGGHFILSIFGENFSRGYPALVALTAGYAIAAAAGPVTVLLNATGNQAVTARVFSVAVVLGIALNLVFISFFGLLGAAIATAIVTIFRSLTLRVFVKRILDVETCYFLMKS